MPRAYFDPEKLSALARVFAEARTILEARGASGSWELDQAAKRILLLAAEGVEPAHILVDATRLYRPAEKPLDANRNASRKMRVRKAASRVNRRSQIPKRAVSAKGSPSQSGRD